MNKFIYKFLLFTQKSKYFLQKLIFIIFCILSASNINLNAYVFEKAYVSITDLEKNEYFDTQIKSLAKEVVYNSKGTYISESESEKFLSEYDIIVLGTHDKINLQPGLNIRTKIIATLSIATGHLEQIKTNYPQISIVNSPTGNVISVAEHAFAFILSLYKELQKRHLENRSNLKKGKELMTTELCGKTIGLIGFGNTAKAVYKIAKTFGMNVIVYTAHPEKYAVNDYDVEFMSLNNVIKKCDILSLHIPLNSQTYHFIDAEKLKCCKPGMYLINVSREDLVNHDGFRTLLETGQIGGLGLDYDHNNYDFRDFKNVWITPHIAGVTIESKIKMGNELINNIKKVLI